MVHSGQAADVEARLAEEAADQRARASEIRREKRLAKIKFMDDMDDRTEVLGRRNGCVYSKQTVLRLSAACFVRNGRNTVEIVATRGSSYLESVVMRSNPVLLASRTFDLTIACVDRTGVQNGCR